MRLSFAYLARYHLLYYLSRNGAKNKGIAGRLGELRATLNPPSASRRRVLEWQTVDLGLPVAGRLRLYPRLQGHEPDVVLSVVPALQARQILLRLFRAAREGDGHRPVAGVVQGLAVGTQVRP